MAIECIYCKRNYNAVDIKNEIQKKWNVVYFKKNETSLEKILNSKETSNVNLKQTRDTIKDASEFIKLLFLPNIIELIDSIGYFEFTTNEILIYDKKNNLLERSTYEIKSTDKRKMIIIIKGAEYELKKESNNTYSMKTEYGEFYLKKLDYLVN